MRKIFIFLVLIGLLAGVRETNARAGLDVPVEVVQIRDLGLSDRDETKSVIEIAWRADPLNKEKIAFFNLILFVTYADGTTVNERRSVAKNVLSARIEIPSVKSNGSRPSAVIKKMEAKVFAVYSKK